MANVRKKIYLKHKNDFFKLFSVEQNSKDGSIYFFSKTFTDIEFFSLQKQNSKLVPLQWRAEKPGKISFHASGINHIKYHNDYNEPYLKSDGCYLKNKLGEMGVKHLFTLFPSLSKSKSEEPNQNNSNHVIDYKGNKIKPSYFMFFAVPVTSRKLDLKFSAKMHSDNLVNDSPPLGFGNFLLNSHHVFWVSCSIKNTSFPSRDLVGFYDGIMVPSFLKVEKSMNQPNYENSDIVFNKPVYELNNYTEKQSLTIYLPYKMFSY